MNRLLRKHQEPFADPSSEYESEKLADLIINDYIKIFTSFNKIINNLMQKYYSHHQNLIVTRT